MYGSVWAEYCMVLAGGRAQYDNDGKEQERKKGMMEIPAQQWNDAYGKSKSRGRERERGQTPTISLSLL